jgi:hypothetical protein
LTIAKKLFAFLKVLPAIFGCLVFLFSIISPFFLYTAPLGSITIYYWSYRHDFYAPMRQVPTQYWFIDNWENAGLAAMSWTLVLMFIFQVLTLVFGVGSVFFNRRILSIAPVLLCLGVLGLMMCTGHIISPVLGEYQKGYYLVFLSLTLFISDFMLKRAKLLRKVTQSGAPMQTQTATILSGFQILRYSQCTMDNTTHNPIFVCSAAA